MTPSSKHFLWKVESSAPDLRRHDGSTVEQTCPRDAGGDVGRVRAISQSPGAVTGPVVKEPLIDVPAATGGLAWRLAFFFGGSADLQRT